MKEKKNKRPKRVFTNESLREIASKYKTKGEFYRKDNPAVISAKKRGIFDEITSHMATGGFSLPQLYIKEILENLFQEKCSYNDRKEIKPYELDIFFKNKNLAVEFNGDFWHSEPNVKERDKQKREICLKKNILLLTIIGSRKFHEKEARDAIIKNLDLINNWCRLNLKVSDVMNVNLDFACDGLMLKDIVDHKKIGCKNINDFIKKNNALYHRILRAKKTFWLDDLRETVRKRLPRDEIKEKIKEFKNKKELRDTDPNLYWMAFREGQDFLKECMSHMPLKINSQPLDFHLSEARKYKSVKDFSNNSRPSYKFLLRRGLLRSATKHCERRWTKDECFKMAEEMSSIEEACLYPHFINAVSRKNLLEEIFEFIKKIN